MDTPMVEMTKAEAVERYGERMPERVQWRYDTCAQWSRGTVPLDWFGDGSSIRFPDPDHGVKKSPVPVEWPRLNISPEFIQEGRLYSIRSKQAETPPSGRVNILSGDPEIDEVNRKARAAIDAHRTASTRPLVTMEAWQAAALFGEAMVGVEARVDGRPGMLASFAWMRDARAGFGGWSRHTEITFPLPRVRYVPTEEQPGGPSVGEVWVDMGGNYVSLILSGTRTLEMWVEGIPPFRDHGPEAVVREHGAHTRLISAHARVRPVPADAVEVSGGRSVISGSSKQHIVQEGHLFGIHEPGKFGGIVANPPEPTFECLSCCDTGRRTYRDGKERDCGGCGDGPCVECDMDGLIVHACCHNSLAANGEGPEGSMDDPYRGVLTVRGVELALGIYTRVQQASGSVADDHTCLFASRPKLSVPIDNQADLAELVCPDA